MRPGRAARVVDQGALGPEAGVHHRDGDAAALDALLVQEIGADQAREVAVAGRRLGSLGIRALGALA